MASIGWIFFSDEHRNRVGSVLDLLKAEGVVDELGVGTLRDGLANEMFPGVSTIQTRAKYFFIIPYILQEYEGLKPAQRKTRSPSRFLEEEEYEIMWYLAEKYKHEDGHGVIGITKRRRQKIERRPSAIYWNGLFTYQFIDTRGLPAANFLKQAVNPSIESLLSDATTGDDSAKDDRDAEYESLFRIRIPRNPDWKENLALELDREEASFFADRIETIASKRLVAALLKNQELWDIFSATENFMEFVKASAHLPLSDPLKRTLVLAHDFSELMYGVHLAYNAQLQKLKFSTNHFENDWEVWSKSLKASMLKYEEFRPQQVINLAPRTRPDTICFVENWWQLAQSGFTDEKKIAALVKTREVQVKSSKARLQWNKTDDVIEEQWIGLSRFDYRYAQAKRILEDIRSALHA